MVRREDVMAQALAEVAPETVSTSKVTELGDTSRDPIEAAALSQAFRASTDFKARFCAPRFVKSNIGHLDAAAGMAGFDQDSASPASALPPVSTLKAKPKFLTSNTPFMSIPN